MALKAAKCKGVYSFWHCDSLTAVEEKEQEDDNRCVTKSLQEHGQ